jgi:ribonuclease D
MNDSTKEKNQQSSARLITDREEFLSLCDRIREAGVVAFDTEFVSEYTYRPELCLLQFATVDECVAVDPYQVGPLDCWWELMADEETTVVVHGGQAEIKFCFDLADARPRNLADVQLAEGFRSRSYPLSYVNLVNRVLSRKVRSGETRTDWRRRPLSDRQIEYALDDVAHLLTIWKRQKESLASRDRLPWVEAELHRMIDDISGDGSRPKWKRISGMHKLSRRGLATLRELVDWRDSEAEKRDKPVRRVMRDDLLLEIAKRQPKTVGELTATRDMNRGDYKRSAPELVQCVERGLAVDEKDLPRLGASDRPDRSQDEHVLGKLLGIALANRCAQLDVAMALVGTNADLRGLVRWHLDAHDEGPRPRLATGWRADVCGDLLTDLLDGKISLRVADPESDHPLVFERVDE